MEIELHHWVFIIFSRKEDTRLLLPIHMGDVFTKLLDAAIKAEVHAYLISQTNSYFEILPDYS